MKHQKLAKELGLFDVYAIATGAMFSSGFFLLPGLAAAVTGPSVFFAYFVSGIIVLPTMFSVAELATAMPRAGGTYYIIDRSLGPMLGTIGGLGSWFALVLKSAFALLGMGAYLAIFFDVAILPVALILTVVFGIINLVGAKETTFLQKVLVTVLVGIMVIYIIQGVMSVLSIDLDITRSRFRPFFRDGAYGFFATVGMVFVSYAGLTKVASIAEEVKNPDKNIPLGMFLSIITALTVYVIGVLIMVSLLELPDLMKDLTPVATAGEVFLNWLPEPGGIILVVIAAVAAFASTGNAGIMSASRYPFAMARDELLNNNFAKVSRFGTPYWSIAGTVILMLLFLLAFNVAEVAKLASAFQLLLFGLLNLSVIVMRESRIEEYDPGFRSPLYPWMQIIGIIFSIILIFEMGLLPVFFTSLASVAAVWWFKYYAQGRVMRQGAIFHVHARLGQQKDTGLEREMRVILREKGLRQSDPYEEMVSKAVVQDYQTDEVTLDQILENVHGVLKRKIKSYSDDSADLFYDLNENTMIPIADGVVLFHTRIKENILPEMVLVRIKEGMEIKNSDGKVYSLIFLVSTSLDSGQHLRILAQIAEMVAGSSFMERWRNADIKEELKEVLLRDERFIRLVLDHSNGTGEMIGKMIKELSLPGQSLITIIRRDNEIRIPHGTTVLQEGDELSIIGEVDDIEILKELTSG